MPTTLTAGDIAIVGFNTTNPDSVRFILLVDITAGTTFNVTDNGWQSNGSFTTTEGILTYTAPSNISAGTVLTWTNGSSSNSPGFNSNSPFGFAFNTTNDSVTIYTGTLASPTLIYALNSGTTGWSPNAINSTTSAEPTSANNGTLVTGTSTLAILNSNGYYNGVTTSGTKPQLLSAISNPANWTASSSMTNLSNWQSSFTVNPGAQPDLTISLSDSPDPVTVGNNLTYTITVNNNGNANATGVAVDFTLPGGLSVVGTPGVSSSFIYTGTTGGVAQFTGGSINAGSNATLTLQVTPASTGTLTSGTAVIDPNNTIIESDETNNNAVAVSSTVNPGLPNLNVGTSTPGPITAGVPFNYILDIQNNGGNNASGVVLQFTLPANLTYNSSTITGGSFAAPIVAGNVLNFNGGSINAGNFDQILVNVTPTVAGTLGSGTLIADPSNIINESNEADNSINTATATVNPGSQPDLTISLSDSPDPVTVGNNLTYTITVNNNGNANATGVAVDFSLPAGLSVIGTPGVSSSFIYLGTTGGVAQFTGGNINAGNNATLTLQVTPASTGTLTSGTAVVDPSNTITESNESNNNAVGITTTINSISAPTKIHDIQGTNASFNPTFGGTQTIEGIVTRAFQGSTKLNGFYLQEEDTDVDSNPTTSEAIFVYDPSGLFTGNVGDKVRITGTVSEYSSGTGSSLTQLSSLTNLTNLGASTLPTITNIQLPVTNVSDLERYEGMLVNVSAASGDLTVTENYQLGTYGQVVLAATGASNQTGTDARLDQYTQFNNPSVSGYSAYQSEIAKRKIYLDDGSITQNLDPILFGRGGNSFSATNTLRSGDTVANITGVLDERFEGYRIQTSTPVNFTATNARSATPSSVGGSLKVASFNLLNYFNGDGLGGGFPTARGAENATEFTRQHDKIIQAIIASGADILGLMELENDGYSSSSAIQDLVNGLNVFAGAGTYTFVNPGTSLATDEITVGLIYKSGQVTPVAASATMPNAYGTGAFDLVGRKPLAQTFQQISTGGKFTVVVNHFKSKSSNAGGIGDTDIGDGQGLSNGTRTRQAQDLVTWLATNPTGTTDSDYLIIGDLNSYAKEDPVTTLANAGYNSVLPITSYSFVFDGQVGSLDHALATSSLTAQVTGAEKWHINADEPSVLDYNTNFKSPGQISSLYNADPYRSSDHDPVIVGLNLTLPTISIQAIDPNASEAGNDPGTFRISRSGGGSVGALNVTYTVAGQASANDYTPSLTGVATIAANQSFVDVTITPFDDSVVEGNETVILTLVDGSDYDLSANSSATVIIADNDTQPNPQPNLQPQPQPDPQTNLQPQPQPDPTPNRYNCGCEDLEKLVNNSHNGTPPNSNFPHDLIIGNDNYDLIFGGIGNDTIFGMSGDDLIFGNQDRDVINGNKGNDTIFAGKDDDFVRGGQDNDLIFGDLGNDTICGDLGNDTVFGILGDDILLGNKGDDVLNGNQGKDTVCGGEGNDLVRGGQDDDLVFGGSGDDTVYGDLGNDTIGGCEGNDLLIGGKGRDIFVLAQGQGSDIITDFVVGEDLLGLTNNLTFSNLTITHGSGNQAGNTLIRVTATNELLVSLIGVSASSINASAIAII